VKQKAVVKYVLEGLNSISQIPFL